MRATEGAPNSQRGDSAMTTASEVHAEPGRVDRPGSDSLRLQPRAVDDQAAPRARRSAGPRPDRAGPDAIRVLIVDDHATLAGALAMAIDQQPGMRCVGTVVSVEGALAAVVELKPDVVLLDVFLPDGSGIEAIPKIKVARPGVRILVLTGHTDVDVLMRAAAAGATGFLPKESTIAAVIEAIRAASAGQILVDGTTLAVILGRLANSSRQALQAVSSVPVLTRRERDVLALMGQGLDPNAIAGELGISRHTSRGYLKTLMAKLGAHSQLEVVVISTRMGLLPRATG
jgi:DNA-binding NarL/FixJ family response regulator